MSVVVYGIANCDTVKKACNWLDGRGIAYTFHDYRKQGIESARLARWIAVVDWEKVLNRAGTTFRKLTESDKADIDAAKAADLLAVHSSAIKRPIVEHDGGLLVGFNEAEWGAALA